MQLTVNDAFYDYEMDWDHKFYLLVGAYGSSKSYSTAEKIILKCFEEKRKVLVVREVFDTIKESCFDLLKEILIKMDMLEEANVRKSNKVIVVKSPIQLKFPNGSRIIFKGMDKPEKVKSINGVSIVWIEEAPEVKYDGFKELIGRVRTPDQSVHFILTCNPVGMESWVYKHFFKNMDEDGNERVVLDDETLYKYGCLVKNGVFYHHSLPEDNLFLNESYIETLENIKTYDPDLYRVARHGRFGVSGARVLPNFERAKTHFEVVEKANRLSYNNHYIGMDFGFEESYNAIVKCAVDLNNSILYIYWEYYSNRKTDIQIMDDLESLGFDKSQLIIADSASPKDILFYNQSGFKMRGADKPAGSRLQNTRKMKRFKKIICSPKCKNTIRELSNLVYFKDSKGEVVYDKFNIDPHCFSSLWYALDRVTVADVKFKKRATRQGEVR